MPVATPAFSPGRSASDEQTSADAPSRTGVAWGRLKMRPRESPVLL